MKNKEELEKELVRLKSRVNQFDSETLTRRRKKGESSSSSSKEEVGPLAANNLMATRGISGLNVSNNLIGGERC